MRANAFLNDNILTDLCGGCDCKGFVPSVTFSYNAGAKTLALTDASTYGTGAARKAVQLYVSDSSGKAVSATLDAGTASHTFDVSTLDASEGFLVKATVVSNAGCISDGHAGFIGISVTAGALGYWDREYRGLYVTAPSVSFS